MKPRQDRVPTPRSISAFIDRLPGAARAAASDAPILILGEAGSGRTTLGRALHAASARAGSRLVEVDVGSIPSSLFESELFGHLPGAFTGAESASVGRIGRAEGGTLLLDHVEELPLGAQPKLLRLLSEGRYSPLGGDEREVDVRHIAVGSDDLPRRVEQGAFRADLYYRLEVLTLRLPPLRERLQELPEIARSLLEDLEIRLGRTDLELGESALKWMLEYGWPGNLRELRNVLERAAVLQREGALDPEPPASFEGRPRTLVEVEKAEILRALAYTRGHQGRAARLLGISRKALWQKRRRLEIP